MPTYSYACTACDHKFDAAQAFTDDALTTCPECSGRLRKLFNAVGVVFKGSGFYRTDSRDSTKSPSASGSSGSSSASSAASSASGDNSAATGKPAADKPANSSPAPAAASTA